MIRTQLFSLFFLSAVFSVQAQEPLQLTHKKRSYVDSTGKFYQQASLPSYIYISVSPDETPTALAPIKGQKSTVERKAIQLDGHGVHHLRHYDGETNHDEVFEVNADGIAPVTDIHFLKAPHYIANGIHFYGKDLAVKLTSRDEMSGVNATYHSINGATYTSYAPLDFMKEGSFVYNYYTVDNVGNTEKSKTNPFVVDVSSPRTYHNIVGISSEKVISTNTSIYLSRADSLSGVEKTFYQLDKEPFKPYTGGNIAFQHLPDGDHTLTYYSVDHVANKEQIQTTAFYLDKTAPIMSADVLGDRFIVGDKVYFSGRTKLKLTAVDNKSGVKKMVYSVDESPFGEYNDPFYLPSKSGLHVVKYYAVDETENKSDQGDYQHNVGLIYVDLTGPTLSHVFNGPIFQKGDTTYLSPHTQINLAAIDPESGLNRITYSMDEQMQETVYKQPFTIQTAGLHTINYFGYDNVNNRNVNQTLVRIDDKAPEIHHTFNTPTITDDSTQLVRTYPSYVTLFLGTMDNETASNKLSYSINGGPTVPYTLPLSGFKKRKKYVIVVTAIDLLGNQRVEKITFETGKY